MTTKFSTQKRPIFPPPVCKKSPPPPPFPDIPPNSIIVQIIGTFDISDDRVFNDSVVFTARYDEDSDLWTSPDWEMGPYSNLVLSVSPDGDSWFLEINRDFTSGDSTTLYSGFQISAPTNPFHADPTNILDPFWSGYLTVELSSA